EPDNPALLASYVQSLLRHNDPQNAATWLAKLEEVEPKALRTVELKARLLNGLGKGPEAVALIEAHVEGKDKDGQVGALAVLLDLLGKPAAAEKMSRRFVAVSPQPEFVLALAAFLGRQNRVAEALDLCEKAWAKCPAETVAYASLNILST